VVRQIGDETLVYDTRQHHAHCLNQTAALVLRHSDGTRTTGEIAALVGPGADEETVEMALKRLAEAGLLASDYRAPRRAGTSRREVLRRVGLGAALLAPMVTSLVVPTPAEAVSCLHEPDCVNFGDLCYQFNPSECGTKECKSPGVCGVP
jgi:hypothetical protein